MIRGKTIPIRLQILRAAAEHDVGGKYCAGCAGNGSGLRCFAGSDCGLLLPDSAQHLRGSACLHINPDTCLILELFDNRAIDFFLVGGVDNQPLPVGRRRDRNVLR